jgi:hypothetical protein
MRVQGRACGVRSLRRLLVCGTSMGADANPQARPAVEMRPAPFAGPQRAVLGVGTLCEPARTHNRLGAAVQIWQAGVGGRRNLPHEGGLMANWALLVLELANDSFRPASAAFGVPWKKQKRAFEDTIF